jgi:hypothetical protein
MWFFLYVLANNLASFGGQPLHVAAMNAYSMPLSKHVHFGPPSGKVRYLSCFMLNSLFKFLLFNLLGR